MQWVSNGESESEAGRQKGTPKFYNNTPQRSHDTHTTQSEGSQCIYEIKLPISVVENSVYPTEIHKE